VSTARFPFLFTPIKIKGVTIRNRIVSTGHATLLGSGGMPSERLIRYHAERAKGGAGFIVVEIAGVHHTASSDLKAWDEKTIPAYRALTDAVHEHGAKIALQLGHMGRQGAPQKRLTWAPSPMPYVFFDTIGMTPKEMEPEDIQELVDAWGQAASIAKAAGFDGVEIHSCYGGYLLSAFLSPYSNKRSDEYGGALENRVRIERAWATTMLWGCS